MLSPHFKEGFTLQRESRVTITLPDDNAKALTAILGAMHMRFPVQDGDVTPGELIEIARLCDKYGCAEAMWPATHTMLDQAAHHARRDQYFSSPAGAGDALVASAVLKSLAMTYRLG